MKTLISYKHYSWNVPLPSPFTMPEKKKLKCVTVFVAYILAICIIIHNGGGKASYKLISLSSFISI
jgi:hypothetical protein